MQYTRTVLLSVDFLGKVAGCRSVTSSAPITWVTTVLANTQMYQVKPWCVSLFVAAEGDKATDGRAAARLSAPRIAFTDDSTPVRSCSDPAQSGGPSGTVDGLLCLPTPRAYRYFQNTDTTVFTECPETLSQFQEVISEAILSGRCCINMSLILSGFGVTGVVWH